MDLLTKIKNRQALVGIIGLGYVGLPLVLRFCEVGFPVLGFDTDPRKVELLNRGSPILNTSLLNSWPQRGNPGRGRGSSRPLTTWAAWGSPMF